MAFLENSDVSIANKVKKEISFLVKGVREEFDDHLQSINDNTDEIQSNYDYLKYVESKLDKIEEKVENLQLQFSRFSGVYVPNEELDSDINLSDVEKKIFLFLYMAPEHKFSSYKDIAKVLRQSEFLIRGYITNLVEKGIPIKKHYSNNEILLELDSKFKELQMKNNIINIGQRTVGSFA